MIKVIQFKKFSKDKITFRMILSKNNKSNKIQHINKL